MSLCFPQKKKKERKYHYLWKLYWCSSFSASSCDLTLRCFDAIVEVAVSFARSSFYKKKKKRLWESWTHTTLNRSKIMPTPILRNEKLSSYTLPRMRTVVKTSGLFVTLFDLKTKYPDNFWKYENKDKWELGVNRKQECYNWTVESKHYLLPEDRKFFTPLLHITV